MSFTLACVLVRGHVAFTPEYVTRLHSMAKRKLPAHRFVCLTDQAADLPHDIETVEIKAPRGVFGWWAKLHLFNPEWAMTQRILYLDLDVLIVGDLMPVVEFPAQFALAPDGAPLFKPRDGRRCVKKFNSSVMAFDAGTHPDLYTDWNTFVARRLWGDQDWIGERCHDAVAMPAWWFPRLSEVGEPPWPIEAKVVLCKKPKNAEAIIKLPWFAEEWQ